MAKPRMILHSVRLNNVLLLGAMETFDIVIEE